MPIYHRNLAPFTIFLTYVICKICQNKSRNVDFNCNLKFVLLRYYNKVTWLRYLTHVLKTCKINKIFDLTSNKEQLNSVKFTPLYHKSCLR